MQKTIKYKVEWQKNSVRKGYGTLQKCLFKKFFFSNSRMRNWKIRISISMKGEFFYSKSFHLKLLCFFFSHCNTLWAGLGSSHTVHYIPHNTLLRRHILFCSLLVRFREHCNEYLVLNIYFLIKLYRSEHKICGFPNSDELLSRVCADLPLCLPKICLFRKGASWLMPNLR